MTPLDIPAPPESGPPEPAGADDALVLSLFARLDRAALGIALGSLTGLAIFFATVVLVLKGGDPVGPNLALLNQYFPGYSVTLTGSLLGLAYGFATGLAVGWLFALLYNFANRTYLYLLKLKTGVASIPDLLD